MNIKKSLLQNVRQKFQSLKFLTQKKPRVPQILKHLFYFFRKGKITAMEKGMNIQMELTWEELQRKIEQITQEIQEVKEEGLRVDMATAIYKAATVTLDEDLVSQIKKKKDVEIETEDLREKLDTLQLKVQEREAREARIESETAAAVSLKHVTWWVAESGNGRICLHDWKDGRTGEE